MLDTGAALTLVSEKVWRNQLGAIPLKNTEAKLRTYTGEPLKLKGEVQVTVTHNGQTAELTLIVAQGDGPSLFGKNWLRAIRLN